MHIIKRSYHQKFCEQRGGKIQNQQKFLSNGSLLQKKEKKKKQKKNFV